MKKIAAGLFSALFVCTLLSAGCDDPRVQNTTKDIFAVKIVVDPARPSYEIGDEVVLDYIVFDWLGNRIEGIPASWDNPDPAGAQPLGENRFRFQHIGAYSWRVTLAPPYGLSDRVTLMVPAHPATMEITVTPEQDHYLVGDQVELGLLVYDQENNLMTGVAADWDVPASSQARPDGGLRYTLLAEGMLTWTATLQAPWSLQQSRTLLVDGSGPQVVIDSPERGDTILVTDAQATMTVSGRVSDQPSGVDVVYLRGNHAGEQQVALQADGSFAVEVPVRQGMNTVEIEASDLSGNVSRQVRSAYVSTDFFALAADGQGRSHVPGAETVTLAASAFDRGSPTDNPPFDPCSLDAGGNYSCTEITDLATVLELALNNVDFAASQPDQHFNWQLVDQAWQFDLTDDIQVKATLEGDFDVDIGFSSLRAGLAKVLELAPRDGGLHAGLEYGPTGSGPDDRPGLDASYGLLGTLTFNVWLDLTATDPAVQVGLCLLADNLCNPDPPNDCLSDYLVACNAPGQAVPIAQAVSSIDTPTLLALSVDQMPATLDLDIGLDAGFMPEASLSNLQVDLSNSTLDASALEDITINIGTIRFASFEVDLGTYQLPSTFVSDIADQLLDPLLNGLRGIIEGVLEQLFGCRDEQNPLCYVIPFIENWLGSFAAPITQQLQVNGTAAATTLDMEPAFESLQFTAAAGARMVLGVRSSSQPAQQLEQHRDDDFLGQALLDDCLAGRADFAGAPLGGQSVQVARRHDLTNSWLLAAWQAAGFDIDLGRSDLELPAGMDARSLQLQLRPWLPPQVTDCSRQDSRLVVQLGDLEVSGELTTMAGEVITIHGFVSVEMPATADLDQQARPRLTLETADGYARAEVETPLVDGRVDPFRTGLVQDLLEQVVGPQALQLLVAAGMGALDRSLPRSDLSPFLGLAPGSAWWSLLLDSLEAAARHLVYNAGYVY